MLQDVDVVRDLGQTELVGDMPKCPACGTTMVFWEDKESNI